MIINYSRVNLKCLGWLPRLILANDGVTFGNSSDVNPSIEIVKSTRGFSYPLSCSGTITLIFMAHLDGKAFCLPIMFKQNL